ncbi:CCHC-type domain-containing protein [Trichonephila clavipes]|nr:CCHC-type domain-containing protein [Trichonephila clavipes]
MAFLGRSRKENLRMLATELGLAPSDNLKIIELKDLITNSDRYNEEFVQDVLSVIVEERTTTEKQKASELEEKQKAVVVAQQREREFEVEKMKIQLEMQKLSQAPVTSQQLENPKLELYRIIPEINSKEDEMSLYLTIFERQVKFLNIPEKTWTEYLIGSLPPGIAQLIAREDEDDAQNYEKVKKCFSKDFELQGIGLGTNIKEHFLDIWADLNDPLELADKLNAYDNLRPGVKSNSNQTVKKKEEFRKLFPLKKNQPVGGSHEYHSSGPSRTVPRSPSFKNEGRNPIQCYGCGTPGVVKSKYPKYPRANEMETAVNCMTLFNLNSNLYPTSDYSQNFGEKIAVCADTGASYTIAAGIFLDVQGGKWLFSGNPWKQYKFLKKTLEDITLSAFELREDEVKNLTPEQARNINILLDRIEACFQTGVEHTYFIEHRFDTGDQPPIATYPYRTNPVKKQDCQKENFDRRRRKYYKPVDKVWVTIHPISRNNRSRKSMPKREGPYLILTLRSPVTYEIGDPANPDQDLGTYHVSALKDYEEPETERNTGFVAPLKKREDAQKRNYLLVPSRDVNGIRGGVCNTWFHSKT